MPKPAYTAVPVKERMNVFKFKMKYARLNKRMNITLFCPFQKVFNKLRNISGKSTEVNNPPFLVNHPNLPGTERTGIRNALITGGVAASALLREMLEGRRRKARNCPEIVFGKPEMSGDNAVGVALIGVKRFCESQSINMN